MAFDLATAKPAEAGGFDLASAKPVETDPKAVPDSTPAPATLNAGPQVGLPFALEL